MQQPAVQHGGGVALVGQTAPEGKVCLCCYLQQDAVGKAYTGREMYDDVEGCRGEWMPCYFFFCWSINWTVVECTQTHVAQQ